MNRYRYRYRTKARFGPWRATPGEAAEDAIRAGQARRKVDGGPVRWIVRGGIERAAGAADGLEDQSRDGDCRRLKSPRRHRSEK